MKKDALDKLEIDMIKDPLKAVALMLWQDRHRNPEMARQITEKDVAGYQQSMGYLEVTPEVRIYRRPGREAQPGVPATKGKRGIAATPAVPPSTFVMVSLVKKGTLDGIKPIENNEADAELRDQAEMTRRARDKALQYAQTVRQDMASGTYSNANLIELCAAAELLARTS